MHLLVLGATGATGQLVIEQALDAGHEVRALVRSPKKLTHDSPRLEVIAGRVDDARDVRRALTSIDAVVITLGANKGTVMTDSTRALTAAIDESGVQRVVMLSSFAVQRDRLSGPARALTGMTMGAIIKDKSRAEQLLRDSTADFTILYATRLNNGPKHSVAVVPDSVKLKLGNSVSRADVAASLLDAAVGGVPSRGSITITA